VLNHFFYSHPVWLVALVVVGSWTLLSMLGLVVFNCFSSSEHRHKDTETVGLTYAIVAVVYAVLIGFIVVNVFEASAKSEGIATTEANQLSNLKFDSLGLSNDESLLIRNGVDKYLDTVIHSEWPSQQDGDIEEKAFEPGWEQVSRLSTQLAAYEPGTTGQSVTKGEMLRVMDDLVEARRNRIEAAGEHVPDVIWQILLLAGAVAVGYTYLFGAHSFKIHLAIVGLIAATISLVFVLIIELDYPFRGEVSVSDEAFVAALSANPVANQAEASKPVSGTPPASAPATPAATP
jgi:hypothetical protein